jgi:hypothetical protein
MMTRDEVWDVVTTFEKELRRKLRSYEASGIDLHAMYMDVAEKIVEGDLEKLEKDKLPGLLWYKTRFACLERLRSYEVTKRAAWANNESADGCGDGDAEAYCVWRPASGAQERVEEWDDRGLDLVLRLQRIPWELAEAYALHHAFGHTLQELSTKLGVSVWETRRRLDAAEVALHQIDRDEAEGNLQPRVPHETPRHQAAREAIERSCARLRPAATKPTMPPKSTPRDGPHETQMKIISVALSHSVWTPLYVGLGCVIEACGKCAEDALLKIYGWMDRRCSEAIDGALPRRMPSRKKALTEVKWRAAEEVSNQTPYFRRAA